MVTLAPSRPASDEATRTDPVEVLIEEARARGRRRDLWIGLAAIAVAAAGVVIAALLGGGPGGPAAPRPTSPTASVLAPTVGSRLRAGSLGTSTTLLTGSMRSTSVGFALAAGDASRHEFVVLTRDAGRSWVIRGTLPYDEGTSFVATLQPTMVFVTARVGYVQPDVGAPIYLTRDGGATWSALDVSARMPTFVLSDGRLWVAGSSCDATPDGGGGEQACVAVLESYRIGQTTPVQAHLVPSVRWIGYAGEDALLDPSPGVLALYQPLLSDASQVALSSDGGRQWHRVRLPCGSTPLTSLVGALDGRWVLSCFMGGGMMQGTNEVWTTRDEGVTWQRLGYGSEERSLDHGDVGDVPYSLTSSSDDRTLYSAFGGAADGFLVSTDGGRTWHGPDVHNDDGYLSVVPAGRQGAVVFTNGRTFWTSTGGAWVSRSLPHAPG